MFDGQCNCADTLSGKLNLKERASKQNRLVQTENRHSLMNYIDDLQQKDIIGMCIAVCQDLRINYFLYSEMLDGVPIDVAWIPTAKLVSLESQ